MEPRYVHRLRVRYGECDPQGWVFNANYLAFFDVALTEMWRDGFGSYSIMLERGVDLVVAEATIRFRSPARFDDELDVGLSISRLGTTAITTEFAMTVNGRVAAEGEVRHVVIAPEAGGKVEMPDWLRAGLEVYERESAAR